MQIKLSRNEHLWLDQRGGRKMIDVLFDEEGRKYVLMSDGKGGERKIFMPVKFLKDLKKPS
jgi:hypothetical protein